MSCQGKCQQCLLPAAVPGANLDAKPVCDLCTIDTSQIQQAAETRREQYKLDLEATLEACRGGGQYDCLVNLSGGKDSCLLLYKLKREYGLNVLAFTTDINVPDVAWRNIKRTVEQLDVPHLSFRPPVEFYKKMFRFLLSHQESRGAVRTVCYICAPLFESYSIRLAVEKNIPLIAAGYAPGQPEPDRMEYEFSRKLLCEQDWTPPELVESGLFSKQELDLFWNPLAYPEGTEFPRYIAPFHAWDYSQDEAMDLVVKLGLIKNKRSASPIHSNCPINWLLMFSDLKHLGFNPYAPEFSKLIREGKANRSYWRFMGPVVDTMIRRKVLLGRNVSKSLAWLGMREDELAITRESQGAEYSEQITRASEQSSQQQVVTWDQVRPGDMSTVDQPCRTTVDLVRRQLRSNPDSPAIGYREDGQWKTMDWRQYGDRCQKIAHQLQSMGTEPGDRVAVFGKSEAGWSIAESAIHSVGGVVVGLDAAAPAESAASIIEMTQANTVVWVGEAPSDFDAQYGEMKNLHLDSVGNIARESDQQAPGKLDSLPSVAPSDLATIVFTSGTTGKPKGLSYTHEQVMLTVEEINREFALVNRGDATLCWLPMSHLFQRMMNLVAMRQGALIYFEPEPKQVVKTAGEIGPTVMFAVPRFLEKLTEGLDSFIDKLPRPFRFFVKRSMQPGEAGDRRWKKWVRRFVTSRAQKLMGGKLKYIVSGSAPLSLDVAQKLERIGWEVLEAYGISENIVPMAANRPGKTKLGTVGRPLPSSEIRIDSDGEIKVRGPGCIRHYWNEDNDLLDEDGFLATGDMGHFDQQGHLVIHGRKDSRLKTSTGRKIFPEQIERVYCQSRFISDVMISGHGRKFIVGLIVPSEEFVDVCMNLMPIDTKRSDALRSEAAKLMMQEELSSLEGSLEKHERLADFRILEQEFKAERGELTASLKKRRKAIEESYDAELSEMYQEERARTPAAVS